MNHTRHQARLVFANAASATAFIAFMLMSFPIRGEEPFPEPLPEVKTYEWELSPAKEPRFALQYKLLPPLNERIPGNAATFYCRAMLAASEMPKESPEQVDRFLTWFDLPYDKLPVDEIEKWLSQRQSVLAEIKTATQCETCDWGTRFQDLRGTDVITVRLQEFQQARHLARILRVKARVEIRAKNFDAAINTIRQNYRLAQDLGNVPSVIVNLVGIAIQSLANESLGELMATEGSPNLYWALRGLPDPVVDMRPGWQFEWTMFSRMFPYLSDADTAQRSPSEWRDLLARTYIEYNHNPPHPDVLKDQARAAVLVMRSYPLAKRELIAAGYDAAKIEQMPAAQVVAIYTRDCIRYVADEIMKFTLRPGPLTIAELRQVRERLESDGYLSRNSDYITDRDPLSLNTEIGLFENLLEANSRQPRNVAALTAVEAIRMHAAENGGQLPRSLSEITVAPVPLDPATGTPMFYRIVDNRAELLLPPTRPGNEYSGRRFLLRIRSK